MDACAVLDDTEVVVGPEAKMERLGVAKSEDGFGGGEAYAEAVGEVVREVLAAGPGSGGEVTLRSGSE